MKKLILHIGPHKTGTTYLQQFFVANARHFQSRGIRYFVPKGQNAHFELSTELKNSEGSLKQMPKWQAALKQIHKAKQQVHLLSSEGFDACNELQIARLSSWLSDFDVRIVFFVRNQIDRIESSVCGTGKLATLRKSKRVLLDEAIEHPAMNILKLYRRWSEGFGESNVRVAVYESQKDIASCFMNLSELESYVDRAKLVLSSVRANASKDARFANAARLLLRANGQSKNTSREFAKQELSHLQKIASGLHGCQSNVPVRFYSRKDREKILAAFVDDNEKFSAQKIPLPPLYFDAQRPGRVADHNDAEYMAELLAEVLIAMRKSKRDSVDATNRRVA